MVRRVVRKKPATKPVPVRDPVAAIDMNANREAIDRKVTGKREPAKKIAKVLNIIITVGDEDRERSYEDFVKEVQKRLRGVPYGKPGLHVTPTGGHYILDGKVCYPEDFDHKAKNFKPGASPPEWAGGPKKTPAELQRLKMEEDAKTLTSDAYDRKYGIGKYAPKPLPKPDMSRIITPAMQKEKIAEMRRQKAIKEEEDEVQDFDWDMDDVGDDAALGEVADESAAAAVQKMKKTKRVVKRTPAKKTVRRVRRK